MKLPFFDNLLPVYEILPDNDDTMQHTLYGCRCEPYRRITDKKPYTVIYTHRDAGIHADIYWQPPVVPYDPAHPGSQACLEPTDRECEILMQDAAAVIKPLPAYKGTYSKETFLLLLEQLEHLHDPKDMGVV